MNVHCARHAACALSMAMVLSGAAASPPPATGQSADQRAIAALEQRWVADIAQGNRGDLATMLADDFRDIDWQGHPRDRQAVLAGIHPSTGTTQHITRLDVRVWGDTAVATGVNEVHSDSKGWTVEVSFTDVFARIDGNWRAVSSQETLRKPPAASAH